MESMNIHNQDELVNHTSTFNIGSTDGFDYDESDYGVADQTDYPEDDDLASDDDDSLENAELTDGDEFGDDNLAADDELEDDKFFTEADLNAGGEADGADLTDDTQYSADDSEAANPAELNS